MSLTGYALPEDIARAEGARFETHLAKPVSMEALEQLLADPPTTGAATRAGGRKPVR